MKESRMFKLLYYLLNHGKTTAIELAQQFEVSVRTIYRDVDNLSQSGIPIYTTSGRTGGIQLLEHFTLDKVLLSSEEKAFILSGIQSMEAVKAGNSEPVETKLKALFQSSSPNWLEIDFSQWGNNRQTQAKFELLKKAILSHKQIQFNYVNAAGQLTERTAQPMKLWFKSNAWYLQSFCLNKKAFRVFKIHRMNQIVCLDTSFEPLEYQPATTLPTEEKIKVTLQFSSEIAYRVYDEFAYEHIFPQKDGRLIVQAWLPHKAWLINYLLSFGRFLTVLAPSQIQADLQKEISTMYHHL